VASEIRAIGHSRLPYSHAGASESAHDLEVRRCTAAVKSVGEEFPDLGKTKGRHAVASEMGRDLALVRGHHPRQLEDWKSLVRLVRENACGDVPLLGCRLAVL
jgi:hypothetical protein